MQQNINPISFNARILLKKPNSEIKPYFVVGGSRGSTRKDSLILSGKTREPNWFQKLLFGISKHTKMPSNGGK